MADKVNLNTASRQELNSIPDIGNDCVNRIIENRPFKSINDVDRIKGFGDDAIRNLHEHACV